MPLNLWSIRCWACKNWEPEKSNDWKLRGNDFEEKVGLCSFFSKEKKQKIYTCTLQRCNYAELAEKRNINNYLREKPNDKS